RSRRLSRAASGEERGENPSDYSKGGCMAMNELEMFLNAWDREAENTAKLLRALPATQYDFRPDNGGRSRGEAAWQLGEGDAHMSDAIEHRKFDLCIKPPHIERSRPEGA